MRFVSIDIVLRILQSNMSIPILGAESCQSQLLANSGGDQVVSFDRIIVFRTLP